MICLHREPTPVCAILITRGSSWLRCIDWQRFRCSMTEKVYEREHPAEDNDRPMTLWILHYTANNSAWYYSSKMPRWMAAVSPMTKAIKAVCVPIASMTPFNRFFV
jgi:hypothetical protein